MKTRLLPPPYSMPTIGKRAYTYSKNKTGNLLHRLPARAISPRPWPSFPLMPPPWQLPFDSNRAFARWCRRAWRDMLSAANRAAWEALASTITIQNFKMVTKAGPGFQVFQYYHHAWRWVYFQPGYPFNANIAAPDVEPYLPWDPPAVPHSFTILQEWPYGIKIRYLYLPPPDPHVLVAQVATKRSRRNPALITSFVNLAVPTIYPHTMPDIWEPTILWHGVLPIPPEPGMRRFRFRILGSDPSWTPGFRTFTDFTLS